MAPIQNLLLDGEAVKDLAEPKRSIFIFEWLHNLEKALLTCNRAEIKESQKKLVLQLTAQINGSPGPPTRKLLANCLATLFSVGDTFMLFDTANTCNDILKNKDDSPSYLPTKLAAICVLGSMYEKLGRMMGRSYEETVHILLRALRNAESQTRIEIMITLEKVCSGMGSAIANVHKDIYKATKHCLTDRVMAVRVTAARCLLEMLQHASFLYQTELESLSALCFRAFDGSNYEVRCAIAKLLGTLLAHTQQQHDGNQKKPSSLPVPAVQSKSSNARCISLDETLSVFMSGFLRGGASFLKGTGEIIKGNSSVSREIRVGVTQAYVVFVECMGNVWLERNLNTFLTHILDLVANPKAASSHVDAVYSRKCINFILRSVLGKMLGEKTQITACKELLHMIAKQMNSIDFNPENAKDSNQETLFNQHLLVCALHELSSLVQGLGTTAQNLLTDQTLNTLDTICAVLIHPCAAARLAAAWCMRSFCMAVPSLITPLIDRFLETLERMRSSPEAVSGYSCALAAVLGSVHHSPLGIPHTKGKIVFNAAEELLRSASQNSRMSLNRTQAGWLLIGSIMTLGSSVVKGLLPRMLLLWRHSFPRSNKELESEKARGDSFTWQVTLEGRAGALSVMHSFLLNCPDLVTEDITRRLITPIESALAMLVNLSPVLRNYGTQLKAPAAMVRLRLYETLSQMPANTLESSYTHLLRMLVSEFTLAENPANTTNSLLRTLCHTGNSLILGAWLQDTDHHSIEDQMESHRKWDSDHLQLNSAAGSGALEHDPCCLYRAIESHIIYSSNAAYNGRQNQCPGPLPLGVAIIDMSIILFGVIFPRVANKHRLQMLDHFTECIKQAKSVRQEAVQMNIFTALLSGLKGLTDSKSAIGPDDVRKSATNLIISTISSSNALLRCASAEALGRLTQVVGDSRLTAELTQNSFEKLKQARDVVTRTGHSMALGCLHRYVGSMGCSQHLNTSVSILLALAQDISSPVVQLWALHALVLIADSGGPMFRGYVEATQTLCLKLLLSVPQSHTDIHQCIGHVLNALMTTMGPELQSDAVAIANIRTSFICATSVMQTHSDPLVQSEAISCLQQLHLFSPASINLAELVPMLVKSLSSPYLMQRKVIVSCLRQIAHREAKKVCSLALSISTEDSSKQAANEFGLPGMLFAMLDSETNYEMLKNIHDTLTSMITLMAADNLSTWLSLCKNVLTVAVENSPLLEDTSACAKNEITNNPSNTQAGSSRTVGQDEDEDDDADDVTEYHANDDLSTHPAVQPRWTTRVFAAQSVRRIITACENASPLHFDLLQAKEMQMTKSNGDYLILHLSDLIRMSFIAATSDADQLRLEGLRTLQEIIDRFANVPEPEFPGHLLLEQYQAQVGAALRPAFTPDTPSNVTAAACEVCSAWIGSGVARDLNDLRRVHQLLVSSLSKLHTKTNSTQLFNESMATLEKLSILKAWAEVYIVAMIGNGTAPAALLQKQLTAGRSFEAFRNIYRSTDNDNDSIGRSSRNERGGESLLLLVQPELDSLSKHWLSAMKDHALLLLPTEFQSQLPHDGGAFYTTDTINSSKPHYKNAWPIILYATSLWLYDVGFPADEENKDESPVEANNNVFHDSPSIDRFHMIFGICMEALCSARTSEKPKNVISCLQSLFTIFDSKWARKLLVRDKTLAIELCNVLHRQILTSDDLYIQLLCIEILKLTVLAAKEHLNALQDEHLERNVAESKSNSCLQEEMDNLGEGNTSGEIKVGSSLVYALMEVCLCLVVRQIPTMNPGSVNLMQIRKDLISKNSLHSQSFFTKIPEDNGRLVACALECVKEFTSLCSPKGALSILPTILYMTTSIIKEIANKSIIDSTILANTVAIQTALEVLESVCQDKWAQHPSVTADWQELLQSSLATIVDLTKTAGNSEDRKMDEVTMLQAIAVFLLHTPPAVVSTPSLQYPCINHFRHYLQSDNLTVKLRCIQTAQSIFSKAELKISTPYIHALAPRIIEGLYLDTTKQPRTEIELQIVLESVMTVETLIDLAEPQNRIQILSLLVPALINCLAESIKLRLLPKYQRQLHDHSLQWLLKIGPKYPQEFKSLMSQSPELRQKLENAIRSQQQTQVNSNNKSKTSENRLSIEKQKKPTIKLKTDFSNFQ